METKEITTKNGEKINVIMEDPVTLREVLKQTLNASYDGHNEGCLNCAEINEVVDYFIQQGFFKIFVVKAYDCYSDNLVGYCGYFMRKEFAEEKLQELEKKTEAEKSYMYYKIEEIDVTI